MLSARVTEPGTAPQIAQRTHEPRAITRRIPDRHREPLAPTHIVVDILRQRLAPQRYAKLSLGVGNPRKRDSIQPISASSSDVSKHGSRNRHERSPSSTTPSTMSQFASVSPRFFGRCPKTDTARRQAQAARCPACRSSRAGMRSAASASVSHRCVALGTSRRMESGKVVATPSAGPRSIPVPKVVTPKYDSGKHKCNNGDPQRKAHGPPSSGARRAYRDPLDWPLADACHSTPLRRTETLVESTA